MLFSTLVVETGLYSNFLLELAHPDTTTDPQLQELYCTSIWPWHFVLVAFAQTTSNTLSLGFFFTRVLLTSSNAIRKVYLGTSQKNKPVSSMLCTFSRSYFEIMAYNLSKAATRSRFSRSTSAPSP